MAEIELNISSSAFAGELKETLGELSNVIFAEMNRWGEEVLDESQAQVPVDTGTLKESGFITASRGDLTVEVGYAGPFGGENPKSGEHVDQYAVTVHEELIPHRIGKAKFLEDPARQSLQPWVDSLGGDLL